MKDVLRLVLINLVCVTIDVQHVQVRMRPSANLIRLVRNKNTAGVERRTLDKSVSDCDEGSLFTTFAIVSV